MEIGKINYVQKERTKDQILSFYGHKEILKIYSIVYLRGNARWFSIMTANRGVGIKMKYY